MRVRDKTDVMKILHENQEKIRSFGVKRMGLFGSFSRNEPGEESDVDLLVEFRPGEKNFQNFMQLSFTLEELLGRRVELVTTESISPYILPKVKEEVEYVPLFS